jgi:lipopolysaccharide/colanic/teichoic acid biosynthesis glycosyltransferase
MYVKYFKPFLDIILAFVGLVLLSPLIAVLIILLAICFKGKPFFVHPRPGKNERIFNLIKFKSMSDATDRDGNLLPFHLRVTKVGRFIRQFSLDEIPQLFNVLKGDMSLIGPRPLLPEYLERYNEFQKRRHEVLPGITGWAQVNGRNTISWEQKFNYDVYYVDHLSFKLDLKIILLTIKKVFLKEGINSTENINMTEFKGN